ncbi:MAG: LEA type 2 family protein [Thiohalobacteraceae bacterium]
MADGDRHAHRNPGLSMKRRHLLLILSALPLAGCVGLGLREPLQVSVAGMEPLPGEGMEARFVLKLRVQNPNETPLDFDGVAVDLELGGKDFASGVSDQRGHVPRYGETLIAVPVTVPATAILRQIFGIATAGKPPAKLDYRLRGHLGGIGLGAGRFESEGELSLPLEPRRDD